MFSTSGNRLRVVETALGEKVTKTEVDTDVNIEIAGSCYSTCCLVDDRALVMVVGCDAKNVFSAIVSVGPGELNRESIHVEVLEVKGLEFWSRCPYLAQIGENRVWASFADSDEVWFCEIKASAIEWTKSEAKLPTIYGFGTLPLRLPDGRFLAAGTDPHSTDIYAITPGDELSFEKVGNFPGAGRCRVSTVLLGDRFVIGFG